MKLRVAPVNEFLKPLEDQTCREKEEVTFECQMLDDEGEAEWKIGGNVVSQDDRIQIKSLGKGVHRLIILRARITDTGDVSCTCVGQNETKAQLVVNKAEVEVEAKDQDADAGKVKAKAKGMKNFIKGFSVQPIHPTIYGTINQCLIIICLNYAFNQKIIAPPVNIILQLLFFGQIRIKS